MCTENPKELEDSYDASLDRIQANQKLQKEIYAV